MYQKINLTGYGKQLVEDDIVAVEQLLQVRLPLLYRRFLLIVNGGQPEPNTFPIQNNPHDAFGLLDRFFSINANDADYDLLDNATVFHNRVPDDFLPIAFDPGGNLICLAVRGERIGKVYFWDHHDECLPGTTPDDHNVYFIADNFDALLTSLM